MPFFLIKFYLKRMEKARDRVLARKARLLRLLLIGVYKKKKQMDDDKKKDDPDRKDDDKKKDDDDGHDGRDPDVRKAMLSTLKDLWDAGEIH